MKRAVKGLFLAFFYLAILPSGLLSRAVARFAGSAALFNLFAEGLSDWPGIPGKYARLCFYKQTLAESHFDNEFCFGAIVSKMETRMGRRSRLGGRVILGLCRIEEGATLGNSVSILSGRRQHNFDDPTKPVFSGEDTFEEVVIGAHAFIGEKSVIMANVGPRSIVGAGSVVVKPIPANVVAAGNPARVIKTRDSGEPERRAGA